MFSACVNEYFKDQEKEHDQVRDDDDSSVIKGYRLVLDSKSSDETLVIHLMALFYSLVFFSLTNFLL